MNLPLMAKHKLVVKEQENKEAPIQGDVLEAVLSHVPLIDLVPAAIVSKAWRRAVSWSLRDPSRIKPWLIVYVQSTMSPYTITTHAYDPQSRVWIEVHGPSVKHVSVLRSSNSTLLYMLSPCKFAFSFDPLRLMWQHADPPMVWRTDPIVAMVGHHIVVAGGACEYEDDPLAVEIYDMQARTWERCDSMPEILKDSAASTWISVAVVNEAKMYVTEKCSGRTYGFDLNTKTWIGPFDLRPDGTGFCWVIGFVGGRLILAGMLGKAEDVKSVKLWEVSGELLEHRKEMGEMSEELIEKFKGNSPCVWSMGMSAEGDFVYLHNPSDPGEVIQCQIVNGMCRWDSIRNAVVNDTTRMQRIVASCANVGMGDLRTAMAMGLEIRKMTV
jgi:hypothetical protein